MLKQISLIGVAVLLCSGIALAGENYSASSSTAGAAKSNAATQTMHKDSKSHRNAAEQAGHASGTVLVATNNVAGAATTSSL